MSPQLGQDGGPPDSARRRSLGFGAEHDQDLAGDDRGGRGECDAGRTDIARDLSPGAGPVVGRSRAQRVQRGQVCVSTSSSTTPCSATATRQGWTRFLEPSFLSQFLGFALILAILQRAPLWQLGILGLATFCTYSGTGMILLAVGLVIILARAPRAIRPSMIIIGAVGVTALMLSPYAEPLLNRSGEATDSTSSLSLRFVAPYQQVAAGLEQEPLRYLTGAGPGASERVLESAREGSGLAVVYTIIPKVIFEYGLLAGTLFLTFLAVTLFRRPPGPVVPTALAIMLALLSGSLLQPHTILIAWLLSAVWARE